MGGLEILPGGDTQAFLCHRSPHSNQSGDPTLSCFSVILYDKASNPAKQEGESLSEEQNYD